MSEATLILPLEIQISALAPSVKEVYYTIRFKRLRAQDIQRKTNYSARTIRSAIRQLLDMHLISRIPNLNDLRCCFYEAVLQ